MPEHLSTEPLVLLINPPETNIVASEVPGAVREETAAMPPLGLLYLQAALVNAGYRAVVLDLAPADLSDVDLRKELSLHPATVIGIGAVTHKLVDAARVLRAVTETHPGAVRCLGGPHTTVFPGESLRLPGVDFIVVGEAEQSFVGLVRRLVAGVEPADMPGVYAAARDWDRSVFPPGEPVRDLDNLPFPDNRRGAGEIYRDALAGDLPLASIASSRGCPFGCSFCSTPRAACRTRSPANVVEEMARSVASGVGFIYFVDDTFNIDEERVLVLCRSIEARGLRIPWSCRARVDRISLDMVMAMRRAGCVRIQFGVETASETGLRMLNKNINRQQIVNAFRMTRRAGIQSAAYFMIGLPHEHSREDVLQTLSFAIELDPDYSMFNVFTPYPGTALYTLAVERGLLDGDPWRSFARAPAPGFIPPPWTEFFEAAELYRLLNHCFRRFYWRPRMILRQLRKIDSLEEMTRRARTALRLLH
ncbi:radical SAM protein [bacterium]|nr:radical SAM protein [candidate division CSSED10-310 bacterium]